MFYTILIIVVTASIWILSALQIHDQMINTNPLKKAYPVFTDYALWAGWIKVLVCLGLGIATWFLVAVGVAISPITLLIDIKNRLTK